jgi:hypothetical protein
MATSLSHKSATTLGLIAEGHSYNQIVDGHPGISYLDIFKAAEEALRLLESGGDYQERLAAVKQRHPRAYEPWSTEEEGELRALYQSGKAIVAIAQALQRQPSAVESRLTRLNLSHGSLTKTK